MFNININKSKFIKILNTFLIFKEYMYTNLRNEKGVTLVYPNSG